MELFVNLPGTHRAPRSARCVVHALPGVVLPRVEDVELLVSELVANSIRHGALGAWDAVTLHIDLTERRIRVEVTDPGPSFVVGPPGPSADGMSGWGLLLVDRLASRWGVCEDSATTKVWFEIDIDHPPESRAPERLADLPPSP